MRITLTLFAVALATAALAAPGALGQPAAAQTVRVTETDYRIVLSTRPKAGTVSFVIRNASGHTHDFRVRGNGITRRTPMLAPGKTARLTVTLKRGVRYQLWCAPHADKGMRAAFVAR
jgi:plastocyanin